MTRMEGFGNVWRGKVDEHVLASVFTFGGTVSEGF
jgi:hypothetical protein